MMEVTSELSDPVGMQSKHTMSYIFHKILATDFPVAKTLIEYNNNSLEENDEEKKKPLILSLLNKKIVLIWWKCYWL